jgi:hypothetical protein
MQEKDMKVLNICIPRRSIAASHHSAMTGPLADRWPANLGLDDKTSLFVQTTRCTLETLGKPSQVGVRDVGIALYT